MTVKPVALSLFLFLCKAVVAQTFPGFSITLQNNSETAIRYSCLDLQDSLAPKQTRIISRHITAGDLPFLFFIYTQDSSSMGGVRSRELRMFIGNPVKRKITVEKEGTVKFTSLPAELLYDQYSLQLASANHPLLTDSILLYNKNDRVNAELIATYMCRAAYSADTIQYFYTKLSAKAKRSAAGQLISTYITARNRLKEGVRITDFSLKDTAGRLVHLAGIKSNYILLDFWFSSCKPCIESFPSLKELYKQTTRDKLEIVALSVDSNAQLENWKAVIHTYGLPWINLSDKDYQIAYYLFSIETYPTKILVSKDRKILRINPTVAEIETIINGK